MIMMSEQDNTAAAVDKDNDLILMVDDIDIEYLFHAWYESFTLKNISNNRPSLVSNLSQYQYDIFIGTSQLAIRLARATARSGRVIVYAFLKIWLQYDTI